MLLIAQPESAGGAFESRSICTDQAVTRPGTFIQNIRPNHRAARIVRTDLRQNPRKRPSLTGQVGTVTLMSKRTQGNRRLTSATDRSTVSRMAKKRTPTRLTKKEVLDWYDKKNDRGERYRRNNLWSYYALRPEDVWALIEKQGGYCPICLGWLTLEAGAGVGIAIDHEGRKKQGHVRGVLHFKCNSLLGLLEEIHGDPDSKPTIDLPREYLTNPPAKNIKVGDSNLYDDTIEDRRQRGRPGRKCQREGCEKEISAAAPLDTKYCSGKCRLAAFRARRAA